MLIHTHVLLPVWIFLCTYPYFPKCVYIYISHIYHTLTVITYVYVSWKKCKFYNTMQITCLYNYIYIYIHMYIYIYLYVCVRIHVTHTQIHTHVHRVPVLWNMCAFLATWQHTANQKPWQKSQHIFIYIYVTIYTSDCIYLYIHTCI